MIGVIYKNGKEIDRGIWTAGKHWTKDYPDQSITICDSADAYHIDNERNYEHGNGISFKEFQGNHCAYDSNKRVDKTIEYDLPRWLTHGGNIPNYEHSLDKDGNEVKEYKGIVE